MAFVRPQPFVNEVFTVRRRQALALLIVPLMFVAACGSDDGKKAETENKPGGTGIDAVTVKGETSAKPTVEFAKPFTVAETAAKAVSEGKGDALAKGQQVIVDYVGINGRDGKEFDSSWKSGKPATFKLADGALIAGFIKGLVGQKIGSRVLITIPSKDGYAEGNQQAGINKGDSLIFVVDVKSAYKPLTKAEGTAVTPPAGLPTVTLKDGTPSALTVPKTKAPAKLVVQDLIKGKGAKVTAENTVNFHYIAANWRTGKKFDSSWDRQQALDLQLAQTQVKGLTTGLVGKPVGSRVLLIMPPDQGFGQDLQGTDVKKTDTIVFVVDILGAS